MPKQPSEDLSRLGLNLRRLRAKSGVSQHTLALAAGVSRPTIANIEGGRYASVNSNTITALSRALGVTPADLLADPERREPMAGFVDEFAASPWFGEIKPTDEELAWARSLPELVFAGARPTPKAIAKILVWHREESKAG